MFSPTSFTLCLCYLYLSFLLLSIVYSDFFFTYWLFSSTFLCSLLMLLYLIYYYPLCNYYFPLLFFILSHLLHVFLFLFLFNRGLSSVVEQLTPDQPVSGSIPLVLTFLSFSYFFTFLYLVFSLCLRAPIAQSVEHGANNARVVGSSPTGSIFFTIL